MTDHTIHSARAAAEGRAMNSDEQRADRAIRLDRVVTTDERLARELADAGHDARFVADAQAAMQTAMDELGCS